MISRLIISWWSPAHLYSECWGKLKTVQTLSRMNWQYFVSLVPSRYLLWYLLKFKWTCKNTSLLMEQGKSGKVFCKGRFQHFLLADYNHMHFLWRLCENINGGLSQLVYEICKYDACGDEKSSFLLCHNQRINTKRS